MLLQAGGLWWRKRGGVLGLRGESAAKHDWLGWNPTSSSEEGSSELRLGLGQQC